MAKARPRGIQLKSGAPTVQGGMYVVGQTYTLDPSQLCRDPRQPRQRFDAEALDALGESMMAGQEQAVTFFVGDAGRLVIRDGERRWRAAARKGISLRAECVEPAEDAAALLAGRAAANDQREALTPYEWFGVFHRLANPRKNAEGTPIHAPWTAKQIGEHFPSYKGVVKNYLRLKKLPLWALRLLRRGYLTPSHGFKALLRIQHAAVWDEVKRRTMERVNGGKPPALVDTENDVAAAYSLLFPTLRYMVYCENFIHEKTKKLDGRSWWVRFHPDSVCSDCKSRLNIRTDTFCLKPDCFADHQHTTVLEFKRVERAENQAREDFAAGEVKEKNGDSVSATAYRKMIDVMRNEPPPVDYEAKRAARRRLLEQVRDKVANGAVAEGVAFLYWRKFGRTAHGDDEVEESRTLQHAHRVVNEDMGTMLAALCEEEGLIGVSEARFHEITQLFKLPCDGLVSRETDQADMLRDEEKTA